MKILALERLNHLLIEFAGTPPGDPAVLGAIGIVRGAVWELIEAETGPRANEHFDQLGFPR